MNKEFVTYDQALALKELGFDEKSLAYWFNETPLNPEGQCLVYYQKPYDNIKITNGVIREYSWAPLYQQAFRWFREKHELVVDWNHSQYDNAGSYIGVSIKNIHLEETVVGVYKSYEEAEQACLDKLIQIVKNNAHI